MCNEEQAWLLQLLPQPPVVQRSDDGLARSRGRDHQASEAPVPFAFHAEALEDLALVRIGQNIERQERKRLGCAFAGNRPVESSGIARRVVRFELRVLPVALEGRPELLEQFRRRHLRQPHVPLEAVEKGRVREVGRPHVGRREAGLPVEQPRLGVQPRGACVVRHPHLRPERHKAVERPALRGADVGRRQDPERPSTLAVRL